MIVVTGATGGLGRGVVEGLLRKLPAGEIGVSVRNPEKAASLEERGVRVRRGDFAEPASLAAAFEGAEQVLIISANALGEEGLRQHGQAIQAATMAGAKRVLYTSHQAASATSRFVPARENHARTEALLEGCGVPFVSLRNGFYAESALFQLGGVREGAIRLPQDGPVSWTSRADLAEAAVAALTEPGLFDGITPPLTGSQTLDFADIAAIAAEILGIPVVRETMSDADYTAGLVARGVPEGMAALFLTLYEAARAREFAVVDPTLERVLGRKPRSLKDVLREYLGRPESPIFQRG